MGLFGTLLTHLRCPACAACAQVCTAAVVSSYKDMAKFNMKKLAEVEEEGKEEGKEKEQGKSKGKEEEKAAPKEEEEAAAAGAQDS